MFMKDRQIKVLRRPVSLRTVLLLQIVFGALLLLILIALPLKETSFGANSEDFDARRLVVCNAPAPLEQFSIELAGCEVMHCTESISGSDLYRQVEFFIC